jgi:tRNA(adenine34) deaminase
MKKILVYFIVSVVVFGCSLCFARDKMKLVSIDRLDKQIAGYHPDPAFKDDTYGFIVVKSALQSIKEGSGGVGACLVNQKTGRVVEYGRNRQYINYFRSDLHAEMDLLNRYEDRMKKKRSSNTGEGMRDCKDLVLVSSVEPCPMCLTRIINSGIKTVLYVVEDKTGGMVTRLDQLPPFWREFAADREFRKAVCSPELSQIAHDLFHISHRSFAKNRKKK